MSDHQDSLSPLSNGSIDGRIRLRHTSYLYDLLRHNILRPVAAHARASLAGKDLSETRLRESLASSRTVAIMTVKDEVDRIPYQLAHYRKLGIEHFIIIDNMSNDNTREYILLQADTSYFRASGSYSKAHYGTDWVNRIARQHCAGKWILWIDADEVLLFSDDPQFQICELIAALERRKRNSLQAIMIDMYNDRHAIHNVVAPGEDPLTICSSYDATGYYGEHEPTSGATWVKGGVRGRVFFENNVREGPALNKTPLVRWRRHYSFMHSSHLLWPRRANGDGNFHAALLHFKFTSTAAAKVRAETAEQEHTSEYRAYSKFDELKLTGTSTQKFGNYQDLVTNGLVQSVQSGTER